MKSEHYRELSTGIQGLSLRIMFTDRQDCALDERLNRLRILDANDFEANMAESVVERRRRIRLPCAGKVGKKVYLCLLPTLAIKSKQLPFISLEVLDQVKE